MNSFDKAILDLINFGKGYGIILFIFITVVISGILSALIGFEREMKGQNAGLRTHVLVAMGCSFLMSISVFLTTIAVKDQVTNLQSQTQVDGSVVQNFNINLDVSRIAAGILSGIGFMGAGAIIKNGMSVKGLTTAATLWCCAAIGMACGIGFILEALIATVVIFIFLIGLQKIEILLDRKSPRVSVVVGKNVPVFQELRSLAEKYDLNIKNITSRTVNIDKPVVVDGVEKKESIPCNEITLVFPLHCQKSTLQEFVSSVKVYPYIEDAFVNNKSKK